MARNGTVCQAGSSRIAARLRPANTAQAISGATGRIRRRRCRSAKVIRATPAGRSPASSSGADGWWRTRSCACTIHKLAQVPGPGQTVSGSRTRPAGIEFAARLGRMADSGTLRGFFISIPGGAWPPGTAARSARTAERSARRAAAGLRGPPRPRRALRAARVPRVRVATAPSHRARPCPTNLHHAWQGRWRLTPRRAGRRAGSSRTRTAGTG